MNVKKILKWEKKVIGRLGENIDSHLLSSVVICTDDMIALHLPRMFANVNGISGSDISETEGEPVVHEFIYKLEFACDHRLFVYTSSGFWREP